MDEVAARPENAEILAKNKMQKTSYRYYRIASELKGEPNTKDYGLETQ